MNTPKRARDSKAGARTLALLAAATLYAGSCTHHADTAQQPTPTTSITRSTIKNVGEPVVKIISTGCDGQRQGSGTVTREDGRTVIYTAAHVIGANTDITANGAAVTVIGFIEDRDLAVLSAGSSNTDEERTVSAPTVDGGAGSRVVNVGETVTVIGYPNGTATRVNTTVAELSVRAAGNGTLLNTITIDTEATAGLSGGAVLDRNGQLIGTVVTRDHDDGRGVALPVGDYSRSREPQPLCSAEWRTRQSGTLGGAGTQPDPADHPHRNPTEHHRHR